jgi:Flp pilus assembly protein TadB
VEVEMMSTVGPIVLVLFGAGLLFLAIRGPDRDGRRRDRPAPDPLASDQGTRRPGQPAPDRSASDRPARVARHSSRPNRFSADGASLAKAIFAARRRRAMAADVPEVLDVLRATIAAGVAPRRALQAAAESAPPSLTAILGEALTACELGSGVGEALAEAGRTHQLTELMVAGEALDLSELTGAPPGRVLAGVATAAADRLRAEQARLAATAQARLSARVVAGMAPAFLTVLILTAPSDAAFLIRSRAGWSTLAGAAAMEAIGLLWARRIVRGAS